MDFVPACALTGLVSLHFAAVACAWCTRVSAGSRYELAFQFTFLVALGAVGLATWYGQTVEFGLGVPSGITLIVMVLLAVIDFRRTHEPAHSQTLAVDC